jgi:hypothetical protein
VLLNAPHDEDRERPGIARSAEDRPEVRRAAQVRPVRLDEEIPLADAGGCRRSLGQDCSDQQTLAFGEANRSPEPACRQGRGEHDTEPGAGGTVPVTERIQGGSERLVGGDRSVEPTFEAMGIEAEERAAPVDDRTARCTTGHGGTVLDRPGHGPTRGATEAPPDGRNQTEPDADTPAARVREREDDLARRDTSSFSGDRERRAAGCVDPEQRQVSLVVAPEHLRFDSVVEPEGDLDRMLGLSDEVVRHKVIRLPDKVAGRTARPTPTSESMADSNQNGA